MGVSPDGKTVVVTSETTNMVHFIDTGSYEITDNVLVGSRPRFAEFTADGSRLWVTSEVAGVVTVIDANTRKVIKTIGFAVPGVQPENIQPVGVRVTKDGSKAFVALGPANRVAVIDAKTFEVERLSAGRPAGVAAGVHPRRGAAVRDQRQQQRRLGDRRSQPEGCQVDPGRHRAVGRRRLATLGGE